MQITCKCLNVTIYSRGSIIDHYDFKSKDTNVNHPFFRQNIGCVELERVHKEQALLVVVENIDEWVIHLCLNCRLYTHALKTGSTAIVLVNRTLLTKPQEISALKSSSKYSPVFHIVVDHKGEDVNIPASGVRTVSGPLQQQLSEWLQHETSQTEERIRQYSEQQYAALDRLHNRAHKDHYAISRILSDASITQKLVPQPTALATPQPLSPVRSVPELPDSGKDISKKSTHVTNKPKHVRKPSVDAEVMFNLDGMDDAVEAFPSDEELSDTDESGSHDEGIHIPRHVSSSMYAKSLPVNVPRFRQHMGSEESLDRSNSGYRVPQEPMDIAASIKALAKSVHGDAVFGDLPRPRFSSQI